MPVDLEERVNYKIVAQDHGVLDVEFTLGAHTISQKVFWDGIDDLTQKIRDSVPIGLLRAAAIPPPPPPPPLPNVVGKHGHVVLISIPDEA
jgi:hypothetical protein